MACTDDFIPPVKWLSQETQRAYDKRDQTAGSALWAAVRTTLTDMHYNNNGYQFIRALYKFTWAFLALQERNQTENNRSGRTAQQTTVNHKHIDQ